LRRGGRIRVLVGCGRIRVEREWNSMMNDVLDFSWIGYRTMYMWFQITFGDFATPKLALC